MNPDSTPFLTYAIHAVGGVAIVVLFIFAIGVLGGIAFDRLATRRISKALDNGDARTPLTVVENEPYRSRVAVPRQIGERTR